MKKEFIAYQGTKFTIEWYFDHKGKSLSLEYFEKLPHQRKKKLFNLFRLFGNIGKISNKEKFRYEGNKIYAFKTSPDRFLNFFFDGAKIIITNAYTKKTVKMPPKEKQKALKVKEDYIKRCQGGNYYD
ncbi:type II toxin-antitoxin system RelE/ParE family toxin [Candidatus Dependentiae bacterium]